MAKRNVIYWHRLGLKVYEVDNGNINLLRDIVSIDLIEIQEHLSFLKDSEVCLLLSDAISYLLKTEISSSEVIDEGFRGRLLDIIKADIPEDFSNFSWDYKLIENEGVKSVLVFAPIADIQNKINELSKSLGIKFVVIEPESISAERDPNPIVGIVKKKDMSGKDEEVLNIVVNEKPEKNNNLGKIILIILAVIVFLGLNYFLYKKFFVKQAEVKKVVIENIVTPTVILPTPTIVEIKINDLNIVVQNGTKTAGKAGKIVDKIKALGVINVTAGNADNTNYTESKVYFKNEKIKSAVISKLLTVVTVLEANILVDNSIENDVKLILGSN